MGTSVLINREEIVFRVELNVFVSRWCYKSCPLIVVGQFRRDGDGCKVRVKSVVSVDWSDW